MKIIKSWLLKEPINQTRDNFFWNMLGSLSLALSTMVLTIMVNRIMGDFAGGDFATALAVAQLMVTIGYFEVRTYQVTDVKEKYTFHDYYSARIITSLMMIVISVGYIVMKNYDLNKTLLVILLCIYKLMDSFSDVFEGDFQLNGRLDIAGKAVTIRIGLSTLALISTLALTKDLYISCLVAIFISVVIIFVTEIMLQSSTSFHIMHCNFSKTKSILIECFPLFISTFMSTYILNASRYAVENHLASNIQSAYTAIFLPVSIINLCVGFMFKPMLTDMAKKWNQKHYKDFIKLIILVLIGILLVTCMALVGGCWIGISILSLLYSMNLHIYQFEFLVLLIGGGLNSVNVILYYTLSVMRKQKLIFIAYAATFIFSLIIPELLTSQFGVMGAAVSFCLTMMVLAIISFFLVFVQYKRKKSIEFK